MKRRMKVRAFRTAIETGIFQWRCENQKWVFWNGDLGSDKVGKLACEMS